MRMLASLRKRLSAGSYGPRKNRGARAQGMRDDVPGMEQAIDCNGISSWHAVCEDYRGRRAWARSQERPPPHLDGTFDPRCLPMT